MNFKLKIQTEIDAMKARKTFNSALAEIYERFFVVYLEPSIGFFREPNGLSNLAEATKFCECVSCFEAMAELTDGIQKPHSAKAMSMAEAVERENANIDKMIQTFEEEKRKC
ncbi:MAG: hypothetical protein ACRDAM_19675 [Casimicrobium sp.]